LLGWPASLYGVPAPVPDAAEEADIGEIHAGLVRQASVDLYSVKFARDEAYEEPIPVQEQLLETCWRL
jgi:hypothetical protein